MAPHFQPVIEEIGVHSLPKEKQRDVCAYI